MKRFSPVGFCGMFLVLSGGVYTILYAIGKVTNYVPWWIVVGMVIIGLIAAESASD